MTSRPRIKVSHTKITKVMEVIGWVAVVLLWSITVSCYSDLPQLAPTHFNLAGDVDAWGSKSIILSLPLVATVLFLGMTMLSRFPHTLPYPVAITRDNAVRQYTIAIMMIRYLKVTVILIFTLLMINVVQITDGKSSGLGAWFLPIVVGLVFIPFTYFQVKLYDEAKLK